jgi:cyclase
MLKVRIIPILTYNGSALVKTKEFNDPRMVGNPIQSVKVFNHRKVDELVFVDINASIENRKINKIVVKNIINHCFMPITIGGNVKTIEDIKDLLLIGADKILINSGSFDISFMEKAIDTFGESTIVLSLDFKKVNDIYCVRYPDGKFVSFEEYWKNIGSLIQFGEIVVSSIDSDGKMIGYDLILAKMICDKINKPIIFNSGAGLPEHFTELFHKTSIMAAGASSIFHFTQFTPNEIKHEIKRKGIPARIEL